jgi:hypothetical protein
LRSHFTKSIPATKCTINSRNRMHARPFCLPHEALGGYA